MRRFLFLEHLMRLTVPFVDSIQLRLWSIIASLQSKVSLELLPPSRALSLSCITLTTSFRRQDFCFVSFHQSSLVTRLWTNTHTESNSNLSMVYLKRWNTSSTSPLHRFPGYSTTFTITLTQSTVTGLTDSWVDRNRSVTSCPRAILFSTSLKQMKTMVRSSSCWQGRGHAIVIAEWQLQTVLGDEMELKSIMRDRFPVFQYVMP